MPPNNQNLFIPLTPQSGVANSTPQTTSPFKLKDLFIPLQKAGQSVGQFFSKENINKGIAGLGQMTGTPMIGQPYKPTTRQTADMVVNLATGGAPRGALASGLSPKVLKTAVQGEKAVQEVKEAMPVVRYSKQGFENTDINRGGTWYATPESKTFDFTGGPNAEKNIGGTIKTEKTLEMKNPLIIKNAGIEEGSFSVINDGYEDFIPKKRVQLAEELYAHLQNANEKGPVGFVNNIKSTLIKNGNSPEEIANALNGTDRFDAAMDLIISKGLRESGYDGLILENQYKGKVIDTHIFKLPTSQVKSQIKPPTQGGMINKKPLFIATGAITGATAGGAVLGNAINAIVPPKTIQYTNSENKPVTTQDNAKNEVLNTADANNNPGNLIYVGQKGATRGEKRSDGTYWAKFDREEDGYKAMDVDTSAKLLRKPNMTLRELITVRSPASENDITQILYNLSDELSDIKGTNGQFINGLIPVKYIPRQRLLEAIAKSEGYKSITQK